MLQFSFLSKPLKEDINIDIYIPLNIKWNTNLQLGESNLYWRSGDLKTSLIEIGLEPNNGVINSITLSLVSDIDLKESFPDDIGENIPIQKGLPAFKISDWPKNGYKNDIKAFKVCLNNNGQLYIFFCNTYKLSSKIISGRVNFGFDEQEYLCFFGINNLSNIEIKQLKDALN
jgi:hypothetical protein